MPVEQLDTPDDPRLACFADLRENALRRPEGSARHGDFIAEGENVIRRLASAPRFRLKRLLIAQPFAGRLTDLIDHLPADVETLIAPLALLQHIVGYPFHQGVLALGSGGPCDDALALAAHSRVAVILESLRNHDNVGSLFRNVRALADRGSCILLSPDCADPLYRKAIRVSMGHCFHVPFATLTRWPHDLSALRDLGFTTLALTPHPSAVDLPDLAAQSRTALNSATPFRPALVLGSEGPGLTDAALAACTLKVRIPISPASDSLNVATAGALALAALTQPHS